MIDRTPQMVCLTVDCPSPLKLSHYFGAGKGLDKARERHSDDHILKLLREIEVKLSAGSDEQSACRGVGISDATDYNWRKRFGGMDRSQLSDIQNKKAPGTRPREVSIVKLMEGRKFALTS